MKFSDRGGWPFTGPPNCDFEINPLSPQAKGLIAWWPLGTGQYGMARDVLGRWNMTANNTPTFITDGKRGITTLFDDASVEYLSISSPVVSAAPFTVSAWAYCDDDSRYNCSVAIWASSTNQWSLRMGSNNVVYWFARGPDGLTQAGTTTSYAANVWHHVCGVEYTNSSHAVLLDGAGKGTTAVQATPTPTNTTIGMRHTASEYFSGRLADVRIYNRALSDAEVYELYSNPWDLYRPLVPYVLGKAPAAAGLSIPVAMHHYMHQIG